MHSFTFEFEELPLVIVKGVPAALINGRADLRYYPDGEWDVVSVHVEGHQEISREERAAGRRPWVYVPAPGSLSRLIIHRLAFDEEWRDRVSSAVLDQLEKDHASAADNHADILHARRVEAA